MPCCAFAAFILSQMALAFTALKARLLGHSAQGDQTQSQSNPAVEWRLFGDGAGVGSARAEAAAGAGGWRRPGLMPMRAWVLAAAVETALVLGAAYGLGLHFGHIFSGLTGHHSIQTSESHVSVPPLPR
jgi:hypothetical protein